MRTYTVLAVVAFVLLLAAAGAQAKPGAGKASLKAVFTAEFEFAPGTIPQPKGKPAGDPPKKLPKIPGSGKLYYSSPKLRIDFKQGLTNEEMRLIADFSTNKAVVLYPDTLNGYKLDLADLDTKGYLPMLQDFMNGKPVPTPDGYKKKNVGKEQLSGKSATHYRLDKTGGGTTINYWLAASDRPLKLSAKTARGTLTIMVSEFARGVSVVPDLFTIDDSYQLEEVQQVPQGPVPGI